MKTTKSDKTPSASQTIKALWVSSGQKVSLKTFAKALLKEGNEVAKEWFANKKGAKNMKRTAEKQAFVNLIKQATKSARKALKK